MYYSSRKNTLYKLKHYGFGGNIETSVSQQGSAIMKTWFVFNVFSWTQNLTNNIQFFSLRSYMVGFYHARTSIPHLYWWNCLMCFMNREWKNILTFDFIILQSIFAIQVSFVFFMSCQKNIFDNIYLEKRKDIIPDRK